MAPWSKKCTLLTMQNQKFAREFARLNTEQKKAVTSLEGPVIVLAGPGTGKTQVVAMRIAQILSKTHANPRNILALTFTEAGVQALRSRLVELIGPDGYQVTISTFHGLASEVINTFSYEFAQVQDSAPLNDLERFGLIEKSVKQTKKLELLRPIRQSNFHVPAIAEAIRTCKQEAVGPEEVVKKTEKEVEEALRGKVNVTQKQSLARRMEVVKEFAQVFERYQQLLLESSQYDFEDMVLTVVAALSSNPEIKAYYQEKYQYLLVDEYQDSNNSQNLLVETIADFFDAPNLFVVGDDKQAIYRFQGASVANMLHFVKKYKDIKAISLKENYRSPQIFLDAADKLISHNAHQLKDYLPKIGDKLHSANDRKSTLNLIVAASAEAQYFWITQKIKELLKDLLAEEIAVVFRTNNETADFRLFAEKEGIAVAGVESLNLTTEPIIQRLVAVLKAVSDPTNSVNMVLALKILDPETSWIALSSTINRRGNKLFGKGLSVQLPAELRKVRDRVVSWHQELSARHLIVTVQEIVSHLNPSTLTELELVGSFLNLVQAFTQKYPGLQLEDFLEQLQLYGEYNLRLPVKKLIPEKQGVRISTVHGVKGLEFKAVFMANVDNYVWKEKVKKSVITIPSTIIGMRSWNDDALEDERRLFYVGLTRAKQKIFLSYAKLRDDGRETLACQFVSEIDEFLTKEEFSLSGHEAISVTRRQLSKSSELTLKSHELEYIKEKIASQPFSYTHLKTYLTCPKQYLLRYVFNFPSEPSVALGYGEAMHKALEGLFRQLKYTKRLPDKSEFLGWFDTAIAKHDHFEGYKEIIEKGHKVLAGYYDKYASTWQIPVGIEYSFSPHKVMLEDIWLTGKFDRIDALDPVARTVRVVDYKTVNRAKTRGQIEGTTKDSDGEIMQQLNFYALLAKLDRSFPYRVNELAVSFLDDQLTFREESFRPETTKIEELADLIKKTYTEILSRKTFTHDRAEFDRGCELCELL